MRKYSIFLSLILCTSVWAKPNALNLIFFDPVAWHLTAANHQFSYSNTTDNTQMVIIEGTRNIAELYTDHQKMRCFTDVIGVSDWPNNDPLPKPLPYRACLLMPNQTMDVVLYNDVEHAEGKYQVGILTSNQV